MLIYFSRDLLRPVEETNVLEPVSGTVGFIDGTTPSFRHPLTGEPLEEAVARPWVFSVVIENSVDGQPLSGVEDAFLVIEAPVEAKIPRLLAFYSSEQTVEKIGPVRSARPYFVDWASEFSALFVHVGGSDAALRLVRRASVIDLNQFWHDQYFWRSSTRYAPHNVFTSSELLNRAWLAEGEEAAVEYGLWNFKNDAPVESPSDPDLILYQDQPLYRVDWKYDANNNQYLRWQGGEEMKSADGASFLADNVAVVYTSIEILDVVGRREIETVGQGEALVSQDGRKISAVWKKESVDERLRFYAEDGKEISWNVGKTWVEVVSTAALGR